MVDIEHIKRIHFIGIGGIGMSALARYFKWRGANVTGYDKTPSPLTDKLRAEGMEIHFTDSPSAITNDIDLIVVTPAIPYELNELQAAQASEIQVMKRAEVLGIISKQHPTIAVAGTHGKTSVTALIAHLMHSGGVPVTAFIGGISRNFNSNSLIANNPEYVLMEADEFDRSFLRLSPDVSVITSVDADHLDIYGTRNSLVEAFAEFIKKTSTAGKVFIEAVPAKELGIKSALTYGLADNANSRITNNRIENGYQYFDFYDEHQEIKSLHFHLPGDYNLKNAAAAISVALTCGVSPEKIKKALPCFKGVERRFDIRYRDENKAYIDDYAHHPNEISACIKAVRTLFPNQKITGVFQPHLYSRTKDFAEEFAQSLDLLDEALLLPIYPAREKPMSGVNTGLILKKMKLQNKKLIQKSGLLNEIRSLQPEILVTMGAGDIDRFVEPIKKYFEE